MKKLSEKRKRWIERTAANDRSYKAFLYNRFFVFVLLVLGQMATFALIAGLLVYNSTIGISLQLFITVAEIFIILRLVSKNDRPSTKLGWIVLMLFVPVVGIPLYLWSSGGRPTRKLRNKLEISKKEIEAEFEEFYRTREPFIAQTRSDALCQTLERFGYPVCFDGDIVYYESGEKMFPAMLESLKKAKKYILIEYFIIASGKMWSEIFKILLERAAAGVQIRIIYDDFGCIMTLPPQYNKYLESMHENIRCMSFNKVAPIFSLRLNNRDHRKMLVVDGETAFTGGVNLADEYIAEKKRFGYWKDSGIKVTGSAVNTFVGTFFYVWNACRKDKESVKGYLLNKKAEAATGQRIQPYDDSPLDGVSMGETVYIDIIDRATKYVYVFTPYLILDDFTRFALCRAAMRGVDVRIVTPGIPDKKITYRLTRANYEILIKAGVKIYEYTPGFIHAKSMVCDDECAVVGTINLDYRSLYHHFENAVYFSGCEAVAAVKRDCEETFAISRLCAADYPKRSGLGKLFDAVLRLFETMF